MMTEGDLPATAKIAVGGTVIEINEKVVEWFKGRGISFNTLLATKIYSGQQQPSGDSETIAFPYYRNGEVVNIKFRQSPEIKKFWQTSNGFKTVWNSDTLDAKELKDGSASLVITEGEIDALSVIECGHEFAVSVPDGAPAPSNEPVPDEEIEPEHDTKYRYVFNEWPRLAGIKRIIIATDNDEPGKRLAEELVRRLGRVRCKFVEYPSYCKDLNEVLLTYGREGLLKVIKNAKPYPVSGIYTFSELPPEPNLVPLTTGWGDVDTYLRPYFPAFMVVTGTAGSGKSTWVNQFVAQLSIRHGLSVAIASFEMRINPFVSEVLINTFNRLGPPDYEKDRWLEDNFIFIAPEPSRENNEFNVDWLIEKATAAVIRHGIRILVIDPWNEIEHAVRRMENHSDYIGRAIRALKRFGREFDVLVIVVAHPAKYGAQKNPEDISLYDISDSAHFANKADFGVVINRVQGCAPGYEQSLVRITKVRYQPLTGGLGDVIMNYNRDTRTFGYDTGGARMDWKD